MKSFYVILACILLLVAGVYVVSRTSIVSAPGTRVSPTPIDDGIPQQVTLSGTFMCLPHIQKNDPQTEECAFGIRSDDGKNYAVNFGSSADSMQLFQSKAHITAEGTIVKKIALNTDQWNKYDMEGIFTITRILSSGNGTGKLDIAAVCRGALAYTTFSDGAAAEQFVTDCIEGKHPEVIERYKATLGNDVAI